MHNSYIKFLHLEEALNFNTITVMTYLCTEEKSSDEFEATSFLRSSMTIIRPLTLEIMENVNFGIQL